MSEGGSAREGTRKSASFKAVSTAPSINKTPVGSSTPPLPYVTFQDLSNSQAIVANVTLNGDPAYVLGQTFQPRCKGDDAGTALGVKSGTVNGYVKPTGASSTVTFGGKQAVRFGDACVMNGGNNPGIYLTEVPASANPAKSAAQTSNPPLKLETAQERSAFGRWWDKTKYEVSQALEHPWEAIKGAAKGIANIPSEVVELMAKGSALEQAGQLEQAAALQSLFGQGQAAQNSLQAAQAMREAADQIEVPKFAMSNAAQAGGDKISTLVQLAVGGAGIAKSIGKGLTTGAGAAKEVVADAAKVEKALAESAKVADAARDAAKGTEAAAGAKTEGAAAKAMSPGDGVVVKPKRLVRTIRPMSREDMAKWLKEKHGITNEDKLDDMLHSTDFTKPVNLVELQSGTQVVQYVRADGSVGTFFAYPGTPPSALGITGEGRILTNFTIAEPVQVIEGTAAAFPVGKYPGVGGPGGGIQLIFPKGSQSLASPN